MSKLVDTSRADWVAQPKRGVRKRSESQVRHQAQCAVSDVLELHSLDEARPYRLRLDKGLRISAEHI